MMSLPAETVLTSALASEEAEDSEALDSATVVVASEAEEAAGALEQDARPKQKEAATMTDISLRVKDFITKILLPYLKIRQKYINLDGQRR